MRSALVTLLFIAACASGPRPVNVAHVRSEIAETIEATTNDRTVTSMGKTTETRAVIYTTLASGTRQEEVWVKQNGAWKMETATAVSTN